MSQKQCLNRHTKGPWFTGERMITDPDAIQLGALDKRIHDSLGTLIAVVPVSPKVDYDARLIAEAPKMLDKIARLKANLKAVDHLLKLWWQDENPDHIHDAGARIKAALNRERKL